MNGGRTAMMLAAAALGLGSAGPAAAAKAPPAEYRIPDKPRRVEPAVPDGLRGAASPATVDPRPPVVTRPAAPVVPAPRLAPGPPREAPWMSPALIRPPAPRITGWSGGSDGAGGAQCRTGCSRDQYVCLAGDSGDCGVVWARCVATCPESSAPPL